MTYAANRTILDADSHLMELDDFLDRFIDEEQLPRLRRQALAAAGPAMEAAQVRATQRHADPAARAEAEEHLLIDKGWMAMGAFDAGERSRVLDLLGFKAQLVFATFASTLFSLRAKPQRYTDAKELAADIELLYAGSRAQNTAMARFCADDPRLLPVASVPLVDPVQAAELAADAIAEGCAAIMVPSTAAGERSPTHPQLDRFWEVLQSNDIPFVLHVGGGGRLLDRAFHNNAMPVSDHLGGGENIRSKDFLAIHHSPEIFLGTLILDGLFDRFPGLRGGCIEQGAGWVVSWLHHLDYAQQAFRRTEEPLRRLASAPSEYVHRHLKFTPFPGEPVGWMMRQAGPELFMFSTDFPHPEGGRDPLAKFEAAMTDVSSEDADRFFRQNMTDLLGARAVSLR